MKPDPRFLNQPKHFWANVRSISQHVGYTARGTGQILVPELGVVVRALGELDLGTTHVIDLDGRATPIGDSLVAYFAYRADVLNNFVEPRLMNAEQAGKAFARVQKATKSKLSVPMNKQKGDKKRPAYLTAIVNMLIQANIGEVECDYDPRELTTFTHMGVPLRTLARRVDGAFGCVTLSAGREQRRSRRFPAAGGLQASPCRAGSLDHAHSLFSPFQRAFALGPGLKPLAM